MRTRLFLLVLLVLTGAVGCADAPVEPTPAETTSGGETEPTDTAPEAPDDFEPTALIPVPQPGRARAELSPALQRVWAEVEAAIAITPPEPPESSESADVEAWAEGPFADWLNRRKAATDRALAAMHGMAEAPIEERGMGTALFGYLYEDAVSGVRGAPVPASIAADPELLEVYVSSLNEVLLPFARMSAQAYYGCLLLFREVEDPAWQEWPLYCDQRGAEVVDVFDLVPAEPDADQPDADEPDDLDDVDTDEPDLD